MTISATMVRDLRDKTGAGIMECKAALAEASGDLDKAVEVLRKRGLKVAEKKAGRVAATDWWPRGRPRPATWARWWKSTARRTSWRAPTSSSVWPRACGAGRCRSGGCRCRRVGGARTQRPPGGGRREGVDRSIGENIVVRRAARLAVPAGASGIVVHYLHAGGKIGVLLGLRCASDKAATSEAVTKLAKDLALQVCSAEPGYVTRDEVPAAVLDQERTSCGRSPTCRASRRPSRTRSSRGAWRNSMPSAAWWISFSFAIPRQAEGQGHRRGDAEGRGGALSILGFARLRLATACRGGAAE